MGYPYNLWKKIPGKVISKHNLKIFHCGCVSFFCLDFTLWLSTFIKNFPLRLSVQKWSKIENRGITIFKSMSLSYDFVVNMTFNFFSWTFSIGICQTRKVFHFNLKIILKALGKWHNMGLMGQTKSTQRIKLKNLSLMQQNEVWLATTLVS